MTCYQKIYDFFNHPFFIIFGAISVLITIATNIFGLYTIIKGVLPIWIRLGLGLSNRKIAIYAEKDFDSLKSLLVDSRIINHKNIHKISSDSLSKGENYTIMLVNFPEFNDKIEDILRYKRDSDALIIYAPNTSGRIDEKILELINSHRYSIIVNLRGRLLNDIVNSMITTSYEKR